MNDAGIEAIVDRDVAGERVIDALWSFERQHHAPAGHVLRPLDSVNAEIGAAVDGDDAVAVILAAQIEDAQHQADLVRVVRGLVEKLEAGAVGAPGSGMLVEPVQDHGAVIGRRGDESERALRLWHEITALGWSKAAAG